MRKHNHRYVAPAPSQTNIIKVLFLVHLFWGFGMGRLHTETGRL